jgi:hypothetical protein
MKKYYILTHEFDDMITALDFFKKNPIQPQKVLIYIKNDGWYYIDDTEGEMTPFTIGKTIINNVGQIINSDNRINIPTDLDNNHIGRLVMLDINGKAVLTEREITLDPNKLNLVKKPVLGVLELVENGKAKISAQNTEKIFCLDPTPNIFDDYFNMTFIPGNNGMLENVNKILSEKPNVLEQGTDNIFYKFLYGSGGWLTLEPGKQPNQKSYFKQTIIFNS